MTPTTTEDVGNGWKRVMSTTVALMPRSGWVGVWDSLVAAVTRNPVKKVPTDLVCSVYVKGNTNDTSVFALQIEESTK